ncbi:Mbeg1-like protein [Lactococcus protaetiae]|uniref:DUF2974 domain-containing protein n=1 Tax=Lactococcus protaetiae TaxID=2592653 RepID=A0A514Z6F4_9LACT|nr:Mbeg1-like protein [Lactococcus protaetiae]QDK70170.1 DUF2974 domain-containing protein [Lactococcus protaetiae]
MTTAQDYNGLAQEAYQVDASAVGIVLHKGDTFWKNGSSWKVLKAEDDKKNGFQAMAVAPVVNGQVDKNQVVIAYAGTNSSDLKDILADVKNVVYSISDGQLKSASNFAQSVANKYPQSNISVTGHSLGGFLALAQGAEHHWQTVTFNGPDPYSVLSDQAKKWLRENPNKLTNFLNKDDVIGQGGDAIGRFKSGQLFIDLYLGWHGGTGAEVVVNYGNLGINPLNYHAITAWKFDSLGYLIDGKGNYYGIDGKVKVSKSEAKKFEKTQIKNGYELISGFKKQLSSGGLSGIQKVFVETELVLATAQTMHAEIFVQKEEAISKINRLKNEAKNQEEEMIYKIVGACGSVIGYFEAKNIYLSLVGSKRIYESDKYKKALKKIDKYFEQQEKVVEAMQKFAENHISRDKELATMFRGV